MICCFTHKPVSVKDLFARCVGILLKRTTINEFNHIRIDILSVSFSNLKDIENINNHCYNAQRRLLRIIKTTAKPYNITDSESNLLVIFIDSEDADYI